MTDHDLRDLLHEQVADVTTTADLTSHAWAAARRVRRRRALGLVGGAVLVTVLVAGGVAIVGDSGPERPNPAPSPSPSPSSSPSNDAPDTTPDARFRGAPVYWSPSLPEEAKLPVMDSGRPPLPAVIDLAAEASPVEDHPVDRVTAAFAVGRDEGLDRLVLMSESGDYRTLDLSALQPDPSSGSGAAPPVRDWMLSPEGEYLAFPQRRHLRVYDLSARAWRTVRAGSWEARDATWIGDSWLWLRTPDGADGLVYDVATGAEVSTADPELASSGLELGRAYRFGPGRSSSAGAVQSWGSGALLPTASGESDRAEFLVASGDRTMVLTFTGSPGGGGRWLQCCPVVGWASDVVVMFESRSEIPRIIAWTLGTHRFETVSTITGFEPGEQWYVASYARYWR